MTEIAQRLNETNISAANVDRYLNWINLGLEDFSTYFPRAPWLESSGVLSLAAGSSKYQTSALATDIRFIKDARISAQQSKLQYVEKEVFDTLQPQNSVNGVPTVYTIFNNSFEFYPAPSNSWGVQFDYTSDIVSVSSVSAVPEIPRRYLEPVMEFCVYRGFQDREDWDQAQIVEARYQALVARIKNQLQRRTLDSRRLISVRELETNNMYFNNEITQEFFGG